jgi:uncharacterized protein with HEPN domain
VEQNQHIEWQKIIALRNYLAHAYHNIDDNLIWGLLKKDILILKHDIGKLLNEIS